jgi:hypothetical protein
VIDSNLTVQYSDSIPPVGDNLAEASNARRRCKGDDARNDDAKDDDGRASMRETMMRETTMHTEARIEMDVLQRLAVAPAVGTA